MKTVHASIGICEPVSRAAWSFAAVLAAGAHLAFAGFVLFQAESYSIEDQPSGSIVLELAPVSTSSAAASPAPVLGPESAETVDSQPQSEVKSPEPQQAEVPLAQESPTQLEPELAVPKPVVDIKPTEHNEPDPRRTETRNDSAAETSVASHAMAPPKVEAPVASKSAAPEIGVMPKETRAKLTWHQAIAAQLNRFKRYPERADVAAAKGEVTIKFTLERSGRVTSSEIVHSSGSGALDQEAIAMLYRAAPLPRPSMDIAGETFSLEVPVIFRRR